MKTELDIVAHQVVPAEKIQVQKYELRNVHIHQVVQTISRLMNAMVEMDGANSSSGLSRDEAYAINQDWVRVQTEWNRALKYRGLPTSGGHEEHYFVLVMTPNQILSLGNVRVSRALSAFRSLCMILLMSDSAIQEYDIQVALENSVKKQFDYLGEVLADYIGVVSDSDDFDRGLYIPAHTHLGVVVPPESMGEAHTYEPSPTRPAGAIPDVADIPSSVPTPGS